MSQQRLSKQAEAKTEVMVSFAMKALIFFSLAWFCLTVGVFTPHPTSPLGIFFLCVGVPLLAISIMYFVRYRHTSMQIRKM